MLSRLALAGTLLGFLAALSAKPPFLGGTTTVVIPKEQASDRGAFAFPATNLGFLARDDFFAGDSFFRGAWITAPGSVSARDGLGPLFNTNSCQTCHIKDGRGRPPLPGEEMISSLVRISVTGEGDECQELLRREGVVPHPVYGTQVQNHALLGIQPEARPKVEWEEIDGEYADGTPYRLRKPTIVLEDLGYGELGDDVQMSLRTAPAMIGVGLLDTIPTDALAAHLDPEDGDGDGISGRFNQVWDIEKQATVPGRFGWKAEQPTIRQQVASAFHGDIGISSSLLPTQAVTEAQADKVKAPNGGEPEVSDEILDLVIFYSKHLAVPAQRSHDDPYIIEGERLFESAHCAKCHVKTHRTGSDPEFPALSNQEIHPYTDLLLHDMGEGLADGRPSFAATGREWRTPPLWGIGLIKLVNQHTDLLHDGRARSVEEAILWHGGEAQAARDSFVNMEQEERRKLVAFLKSL